MRSTWVISTKLAPPVQQVALVDRHHALIPAGPTVVLLQAPAGYGKTTLMSQWYSHLKQSGRRAGWVSLDERDRDSTTVLAYLALALQGAGLELSFLKSSTPDDLLSVPTDVLMRMLAAAAAADAEPITLFLDDVRGSNAEFMLLIGQLVEQLSASLTLVLSSRESIDGLFLKYRARGILHVLDVRELRFSAEDAGRLLDGRFASEAIDELVSLTEGWPIAIQLARLSNTGFLVDARSSGLATALCEQVLHSLEVDIQEVISLTALFERVTPDLLDAVLKRNDCRQILRRLSLESALVIPIDGAAEWYRHHSLFKEYLRERVLQLPPARISELRARASVWFLERGLLNEAFQYAQATGDSDFMADVAERAGGWLLVLNGGRMAIRALAGLPTADGRRYPRLRIAQLYVWAQDGLVTDSRKAFETLRHDTVNFSRGRHGVEDAALALEGGIVDLVIRIYEDHPLPLEQAFDLERRVGAASSVDVRVASAISNLVCYAYFDACEYERCLQVGELALVHGRAARANYAEVYLGIYMALASFRLGRVTQTRAHLLRALELAELRFGSDSSQACIARALLAQVDLESGDEAAARIGMHSRFAVILQRDGWIDVFMSAFETELRLAVIRGGWAAADDVIASTLRAANLRGLPRLQAVAHIFRAEVRARQGQMHDAQQDIAAASALLGWNVEHTVAPRDRRLAEAFSIAFLRCALLAGRFRDVISGVGQQLGKPGIEDHRREVIRFEILRALAVAAAGNPEDARRAIARVVNAGDVASFSFSIAWELAELAPDLLRDSDGRMHGVLQQAARMPPSHKALLSGPDVRAISPRELEILQSLAQGLSNKQIARQLQISESTVKTHRERLYHKLNVSTRAGALTAARSLGVLAVGP